MPRINFDDVPDGIVPGDTVPDGTYTARIIGIEPGLTASNRVKWDVWSEITDGDEKGKKIKDLWLWYDKGLSRTKACISGCALTKEGSADYFPEDFLNLPVFLDVATDSREVGEKIYTECKPRYRGYLRDHDREWVKVEREPEQPKKDAQGSVFDSDSVPF